MGTGARQTGARASKKNRRCARFSSIEPITPLGKKVSLNSMRHSAKVSESELAKLCAARSLPAADEMVFTRSFLYSSPEPC